MGLSLSGFAATFNVTNDSTNPATVGSLPWAVAQANAAADLDTIIVPAMTYTGVLFFPQPVIVQGAGMGKTIFQGSANGMSFPIGSSRALSNTAACTLRDVTIRYGGAQFGGGGGIQATAALTLERVEITGCFAGTRDSIGFSYAGGGVQASGGLIARDSVFHSNRAFSTGGDTVQGAAISCQGNNPVLLERCTIANNFAFTSTGGGLAQGGGAYIQLGTGQITIRQCTFSGNAVTGVSTVGSGGGVFFTGSASTPIIESCTFVNNAAGSGGGIHSPFTADNTGPIIRNCIIANNTASTGPNIFQRVQSRGYNLIENTAGGTVDDAGGGNFATANQTGVDPALLGPRVRGGDIETYVLDLTSPALNMGIDTDTSGVPFTTDQRGLPRVSGAAADIGATERDVVVPQINSGILLSGPTTTDKDTVLFGILFTEELDRGLELSDLSLDGTLAGAATISIAQVSSTSYTIHVTMNNQYADGTIGLSVNGALSDFDGNTLIVPVSSSLYTIRNVPGDTEDNGDVTAAELNTVVLWFRGLLP